MFNNVLTKSSELDEQKKGTCTFQLDKVNGEDLLSKAMALQELMAPALSIYNHAATRKMIKYVNAMNSIQNSYNGVAHKNHVSNEKINNKKHTNLKDVEIDWTRCSLIVTTVSGIIIIVHELYNFFLYLIKFYF